MPVHETLVHCFLSIFSFENWSQKALSVKGRQLVIEGEVAHQVLGLWMVKKLGRISYDPVEVMRDGCGMDALEVSKGLVS